jgi:hypothetical protein
VPVLRAPGLAPIVQARPDAERFGCPIVLVAPDPTPSERTSLTDLLDHLETTAVD